MVALQNGVGIAKQPLNNKIGAPKGLGFADQYLNDFQNPDHLSPNPPKDVLGDSP